MHLVNAFRTVFMSFKVGAKSMFARTQSLVNSMQINIHWTWDSTPSSICRAECYQAKICEHAGTHTMRACTQAHIMTVEIFIYLKKKNQYSCILMDFLGWLLLFFPLCFGWKGKVVYGFLTPHHCLSSHLDALSCDLDRGYEWSKWRPIA